VAHPPPGGCGWRTVDREIPRRADRVRGVPLTVGQFHAYAVRSRWGPHVTLQAGVVHLGRHWTTTTRRSVKVRAIDRVGWASATVEDGHGRTRVIGGAARVLDGARPGSLLGAPLDSVLAGGAVARLAATQLDQLAGYLEASGSVPSEFLPWGRVLLVISCDDELVLDGGVLVSSRGRWRQSSCATFTAAANRRRRSPWRAPLTAEPVPDPVLALVAAERDCLVGLETPVGAVAVPGRWDPHHGQVAVPVDALAALGVVLPGPACITFDESTSRRPDRKLGLMLRGAVRVDRIDGPTVTLTASVERLTHWSGFASSSTRVVS
jgi:hypothetical protein